MTAMLSKNKAKFIKSLGQKKFREAQGCFSVEGKKSVLELAGSDYEIQSIVCVKDFWLENGNLIEGKKSEVLFCSSEELESISQFQSAGSVLAVATIKHNDPPKKPEGLTLALDRVSDPGNLGMMIRTADWFGMKHILASENTVDFYNSKVLQASMGSFCRVFVHYVKLENYLLSTKIPIYAADKKGKPVHDFPFPKDCILILGSESHGISGSLSPLIHQAIGIPGIGNAESLNIAASAAIFCDNYRRITASE